MPDPRLPRARDLTFGLSLVPPDALQPLAREAVAAAETLAGACGQIGAAFAFVPSWESWAAEAVERLLEGETSPFWAVNGPLWPVLERRGLEAGLRDTLLDPEGFAAELDEACEATEWVLRDGLERGARAIVVCEDMAGSAGPLVAPDFAIETLMPRLARLAAIAAEAGVPAVLHSDGDVRLLLSAIRKAGFSAVHAGGGLPFEAFDRLFWAARAEDVAVVGGLPTVELTSLPHAEVVGSRLGLLARAGGLLAADDGGITTAAEVVVLVRALAAARAAAG